VNFYEWMLLQVYSQSLPVTELETDLNLNIYYFHYPGRPAGTWDVVAHW